MSNIFDSLRKSLKEDEPYEYLEFQDQLASDMSVAFARAAIRIGAESNTVLDFCDGDVMLAAEHLDIDLTEEVKSLRKDRLSAAINKAMDCADQDDDGQYVDLEDIIRNHPAM